MLKAPLCIHASITDEMCYYQLGYMRHIRQEMSRKLADNILETLTITSAKNPGTQMVDVASVPLYILTRKELYEIVMSAANRAATGAKPISI